MGLAEEVFQREATFGQSLKQSKLFISCSEAYNLIYSPDYAQKFSESTLWNWRSCSLGLIMGLIALRQSNGDERYASGIEFKTTESLVRERYIQYAKRSGEIFEIAKELSIKSTDKELLELREIIRESCRALQIQIARPERLLLAWYAKRSGFDFVNDVFKVSAIFDQLIQECLSGR